MLCSLLIFFAVSNDISTGGSLRDQFDYPLYMLSRSIFIIQTRNGHMAVSWSTNVAKAINFVKQALVILLRGRIQLKSKQCFSMRFVL